MSRPLRTPHTKQLLSAIATGYLAFAGPAILAQVTSGNLTGVIKDPAGAVIPLASLVLTNEDTGVQTPSIANNTGEILIANLPIGLYDLHVTAPGFRPFDLKSVAVSLNKASNVTLSLVPGDTASVEVTVTSGVVLDTTSNNLTTNFTPQELATLPATSSGGYGVLNAALLAPGVVSSGGLGQGVGGSIAGQRPRNNNFTIEGVDNNNVNITGPLVYVPNDAVASFTLVTSQFSPEFGHSSGGQFNTTVLSGNNHLHGRLYEYMQNRNLNAASGPAGGKTPNQRYDYNRYGAQFGGPILRDKLFAFANFERQTTGQDTSYYLCTPTAAGLTTLQSLAPSYGFNATNLAQMLRYGPTANITGTGGTGIDASLDNACADQTSGPQYMTVTANPLSASAASTNIPLGNYFVATPVFANFYALSASLDWTKSPNDSFRARYVGNSVNQFDVSAQLPSFFTTQPTRFNLVALSEYHTFMPSLVNELRIGFNRFTNRLVAGPQSYPGLSAFPNIVYYDQGYNLGPDANAPQFNIQNLYQLTENLSYVKGRHDLRIGFDGRKYIAPQSFTPDARGNYQYSDTDVFLHDLAPDYSGQRASGSHTFYGDQTAFYIYANDTWRITPAITLNAGLRYEFTSVPTGERTQSLNSVASVPGLIAFNAPQPTYTNFAPRFGIIWAPDARTSIRAGFGLAYDVLFDNIGTNSFPPEYSFTEYVGGPKPPGLPTPPAPLSPNFLTNGGLAPGAGPGTVSLSAAVAQAETTAYIPNQVLPYAETWSLTVQRTLGSSFTAELGYLGTRGIHLPQQNILNNQPKVTAANQLSTSAGSTLLIPAATASTNYAAIAALSSIPAQWSAAGFTSKITSYQPFAQSNYNALIASLTRRFDHGLQLSASYTWSKTMDDGTGETYTTNLTPRRAQDSRCVACDYSRSALDRTHRFVLESIYALPYLEHSHNALLREGIGNWTLSGTYTYESPEYATPLSGVNSNLNGDTANAFDRPILNRTGVKGTGSGITKVYSSALVGNCTAPATTCNGNLVGYIATNPNAYYIEAGPGTLPNVARNSLPIRPIDNVDLAVYKHFPGFEHYTLEFGAEAYNALNHAQYIPGSVNGVNSIPYTSSFAFQTVTSAFFNHPEKSFNNNARMLQLSAKLTF